MVEENERLSQAIIVYAGKALNKGRPAQSRDRLDDVYGPVVGAELWEQMLPVLRSFGKGEAGVTTYKLPEDFDAAKSHYQSKPDQPVPEEMMDKMLRHAGSYSFANEDGDAFISHDETVNQVERAKVVFRQSHPEISDEAVDVLGWIYGRNIARDGYGHM